MSEVTTVSVVTPSGKGGADVELPGERRAVSGGQYRAAAAGPNAA